MASVSLSPGEVAILRDMLSSNNVALALLESELRHKLNICDKAERHVDRYSCDRASHRCDVVLDVGLDTQQILRVYECDRCWTEPTSLASRARDLVVFDSGRSEMPIPGSSGQRAAEGE
jgi:hypothetical protein